MKCKVCNHELISGSRQCPYCGAAVPEEKETFVSEFKWNIQDYPKPKKQQKQNISIDWKSGRILDENSGKIYDQSLNEWAEPEEIRDLFTFDTKNERRQQTLDREMDRIFRGSGKPSAAHSDAPSDRTDPETDTFHLPSSMEHGASGDMPEMHRSLLAGLFDDNPFEKKEDEPGDSGESVQNDTFLPQRETAEHSSRKNEITAEKPAVHDTSSAADIQELRSGKKSAETDTSSSSADNLVDDFIRALHNISGDIYGNGKQKQSTSENKADTGDAKQTSSAEPPESRPDEKHSELPADTGSAPTPDSVENGTAAEYTPEADSGFSGFSRLIEAEKRFKDDMEKVTFLTPAEYEEAEKAETKSQKLRFVPTISFRTIEDEYEAYRRDNHATSKPSEEEKGVQISINEPSGTKVTVKTQEISLASLNNDSKIQTREVRLDDVKQSPKNVQVSVEVNAAQGNASVEVTRRHDGATVVKTLDKSDAGHIYIDGEDKTDYGIAAETAAENIDEKLKKPEENVIPSENPQKEPEPVVSDLQEDEHLCVSDSDNFPSESSASEECLAEDADSAGCIADDSVIDGLDEKLTAENETDRQAEHESERASTITSDAVADGSASSEAAQQTVQIPALEARELAAALAERKAAQEASRQIYEDNSDEQNVSAEFWEKPSGVSKMTITDIFGPEARKVIEEGKKDFSDDPEKHAQTSQHTAAAETKDSGNNPQDSSILSIQPEDIAPSRSQTESIFIPAADSDSDRRGVTTDTISRERQAEMKEALDAIDSIQEAERREREKAERKAEKERLKAERNRRKAEKKAEKKAARESAKAEAAAKSGDPDDESEGLSSPAKILIIVLSVLLVIEFTIIGIKLFAPDSGAATLIHRIETQVTGIFNTHNSSVSALSGYDGVSSSVPTVDSGEDTSNVNL